MIHILASVDVNDTSPAIVRDITEQINSAVSARLAFWGVTRAVEINSVHVHDSGIIQVVRNHRPLTDSSSALSDKG